MYLHGCTYLKNMMYVDIMVWYGTIPYFSVHSSESAAPTRHFVVLRRVWFLIIKYLCFEAYPLLAPKCRVGAALGLGYG